MTEHGGDAGKAKEGCVRVTDRQGTTRFPNRFDGFGFLDPTLSCNANAAAEPQTTVDLTKTRRVEPHTPEFEAWLGKPAHIYLTVHAAI